VKGLARLPNTSELASAYREMEGLAESASGENEIEGKTAKYSQWARLDPRLAEVLTGFLGRNWSRLNVVRLLTHLSYEPWPRAILVPLRFVEVEASSKRERQASRTFERQALPAFERHALRSLIAAIDEAFPECTNDLFFIPLQRPNRVITDEAVTLLSEPYLRSGYIGSVSLLAKGRLPEGATVLSTGARGRLLHKMRDELARGGTLTVAAYRLRCKGLVSRRQAQRDLEESPLFEAVGFTRGRRYRRRLA
jgi:hypothetical protein